MNTRLLFLLTAVIFLFLSPIIESARRIEMIWRLKDKVTGSPVVGARVICEYEDFNQLIRTAEVFTNPEGQFYFDFNSSCLAKPIDLIVYKSGYKETTFVDIVEKGRGLPRYLYLYPSPPEKEAVPEQESLEVEVTVRDLKYGKPLPRALLDYNLTLPGLKSKSKQDTTNSNGRFAWRFDGKLSQGTLTVEATKPNYLKNKHVRTLGKGGQLDIYLVQRAGKEQAWSFRKSSLFAAAIFGTMFTTFNEGREPGWSKDNVWFPIGTVGAWIWFFWPSK